MVQSLKKLNEFVLDSKRGKPVKVNGKVVNLKTIRTAQENKLRGQKSETSFPIYVKVISYLF